MVAALKFFTGLDTEELKEDSDSEVLFLKFMFLLSSFRHTK